MLVISQIVVLCLIFTHWVSASPLPPRHEPTNPINLENRSGGAASLNNFDKRTMGADAENASPAKYDAIMQSVMDSQVQKYAFPGLSVSYHLGKPCLVSTLASGVNSGTELTGHEPSRMASMTKTYTAAAILRLAEDGNLDLGDTIHQHLADDISTSLISASYETKRITIKHLLYHISGIPDSNSDAYREKVFSDPQHQWTRCEQVRFIVEHEPKVGCPGEKFSYSDVGYVLLGDIIENVSGLPQAPAFRKLLQLDRLGLHHTWFETLETVPVDLPPRAHQYYGTIDTIDLSPTFDLYGGGGLVSTTKDEIKFLRHLFDGQVFQRNDTLQTMLNIPETNDDSGYAMGIMRQVVGDDTCWGHTGFWGTAFYHCPQQDVTIATDQHQAEFPASLDILELLKTVLQMSKLGC